MPFETIKPHTYDKCVESGCPTPGTTDRAIALGSVWLCPRCGRRWSLESFARMISGGRLRYAQWALIEGPDEGRARAASSKERDWVWLSLAVSLGIAEGLCVLTSLNASRDGDDGHLGTWIILGIPIGLGFWAAYLGLRVMISFAKALFLNVR